MCLSYRPNLLDRPNIVRCKWLIVEDLDDVDDMDDDLSINDYRKHGSHISVCLLSGSF